MPLTQLSVRKVRFLCGKFKFSNDFPYGKCSLEESPRSKIDRSKESHNWEFPRAKKKTRCKEQQLGLKRQVDFDHNSVKRKRQLETPYELLL